MKIEEIIEETRRRIFTKSMLRKGFEEHDLKDLVMNDNFYQPDTIWFTKEQLEQQIPRLIKIFRDNPKLLKRGGS